MNNIGRECEERAGGIAKFTRYAAREVVIPQLDFYSSKRWSQSFGLTDVTIIYAIAHNHEHWGHCWFSGGLATGGLLSLVPLFTICNYLVSCYNM